MAMRQFGRMKTLPKATPAHLEKLLNQRRTVLPNVSKITLSWSKVGEGQAGARNFKYEYVPAIKRWNPEIEIEFKKENTKPIKPSVTLHKADGSVETVDAYRIAAEEIVQKLASLVPDGSTDVQLPDPALTPFMRRVKNTLGLVGKVDIVTAAESAAAANANANANEPART